MHLTIRGSRFKIEISKPHVSHKLKKSNSLHTGCYQKRAVTTFQGGKLPIVTLEELITKIADAIERQEGFRDAAGQVNITTRAGRNNNPGNIWDGICPGKVQRIWPHFPIDASGFVIYPDYATGRAAMARQLSLKISRNQTLRVLINQWDSSDPQATRDVYVSHVAEWTGLPTDEALHSLVTV